MNINHLFTKSDLVFINVLFDFYIKNLSEEYKKGDNLKRGGINGNSNYKCRWDKISEKRNGI